jgi:hypothetical protein
MLPFQGDGYWKKSYPPRCGGLGYVAPCGAIRNTKSEIVRKIIYHNCSFSRKNISLIYYNFCMIDVCEITIF